MINIKYLVVFRIISSEHKPACKTNSLDGQVFDKCV